MVVVVVDVVIVVDSELEVVVLWEAVMMIDVPAAASGDSLGKLLVF